MTIAPRGVSAIEWVVVLVDEFGFPHSEIMALPWRVFLAYQRLAMARRVNQRNRAAFTAAQRKGWR